MRDAPNSARTSEPDRRTSLAVERTQLAWWRTGLTALAVAVGIGRVVPELSNSNSTWLYGAVGIAFAVYGITLFLVGTARGGAVRQTEDRAPETASPARLALVLAGPLLGVVVIAMIVLAS